MVGWDLSLQPLSLLQHLESLDLEGLWFLLPERFVMGLAMGQPEEKVGLVLVRFQVVELVVEAGSWAVKLVVEMGFWVMENKEAGRENLPLEGLDLLS